MEWMGCCHHLAQMLFIETVTSQRARGLQETGANWKKWLWWQGVSYSRSASNSNSAEKKKEKQRLNTQYTPELRDAIYPSAPSFSTLLTLGGRELYPNIQALGMGAYVCLGGSFLQNYRIELQQHAGELVVACYQQKF